LSSAALAGPMGFSGSTMAMGDFGSNWRELWANYAFTPRDAVGAEVLTMRSDDKTHTRELAGITVTRLAQRWNLENAQANVWLVAAVGGVRGNDFSGAKPIISPGIQLDYETTRVYVAAFGRLYRAARLNHDYGAVRAGFSFLEADYDEIQPWLIFEARRMHALSDKVQLTPMLRFISKNYFVELGASSTRQVRFNFMYVF
jgi:hypothetical protein